MPTPPVRPFALTPHPLRNAVLGEVHARPFHPVNSPRRLLHFAFMTAPEGDAADRQALASCHGAGAFCRPARAPASSGNLSHGLRALGAARRVHDFHVGTRRRCRPVHARLGRDRHRDEGCSPSPARYSVSADLHLVTNGDVARSQAVRPGQPGGVERMDGAAVTLTDFRPDASGSSVSWSSTRGCGPARAGALVQRLLEIETYRTLALLGLPEAQALSPRVKTIEESLTRIA